VLITATIDAFEERDVTIVGVPGAFLGGDMDEEVIMTIRGRLADLIVKAAPNICITYITLDANNQPIMYVKLQKASYGCLSTGQQVYMCTLMFRALRSVPKEIETIANNFGK
jgi:hypothetical protein